MTITTPNVLFSLGRRMRYGIAKVRATFAHASRQGAAPRRLQWCAAWLVALGATSPALAIDFNWQELVVPPNPIPFYSGNWSQVGHWDNGTFIPATSNDTASIALAGVPDYVVTLDLDTHIGAFNLDSPDATLDAVGRVFRVDGSNDFTEGTINWDNSQILDSGAGTLTNAVTMNVSREVLIDTATFNQRGTVNVAAEAAFNTTLTVTHGLSNRGLIDIGTSEATNALLILSTGTLVNDNGGGLSGELRFSGTGTGLRRFDGDLHNEAVVNVLADTTFGGINTTVTNTGAFFVAPNVTLLMEASGQVFNQNANNLNVQGTFNPEFATFNFNGGSITSNPVTLFFSTLNIGSAAGSGAFVLRGSSSYDGDLKAGQLLTVRGDASSNAIVTTTGGINNNSTLTIETTAAATAQLEVNGGPIVNQPAGIIDFNGATGTRGLRADVNSSGTININGDTELTRIGDTITNTGTFNVATGATLNMEASSQVFNQDAGVLDVQGVFDPIFATFNFNGGNVTGNPLTLSISALNIGPSAGDGVFVLRGGSSYSGDLQAGQLVTVRADASSNAIVTAASGFSNSSTLTIETTAAATSQLEVNGGPLVNQSAGIIDFNGAAGTRRLRADLNNSGTVNINGDTELTRLGDTITNIGTFNVAPGATLKMEASSQIFNQDAGVLDVQGVFDPIFATFNFNGGNVTSNPVTLFLSSLNIGPAAGDGAFALRGGSTYSGDLQAGQLLTVRADAASSAIVTATTGFTNNSSLTIENTAGTTAQLQLGGGVLTNETAGVLDFAGGGTGLRDLRGGLDNRGEVNVDADAQIGDTGQAHLNSGEMLVSAVATIVGDSFANQTGGVISGSGELDVSAVTFLNDGEIAPGDPIGELTITGDVAFSSTGSLSIDLGGTTLGTEYDQLAVTGNVTLDGVLDVTLADLGGGAFSPALGNTFTILAATGSRGGMFTTTASALPTLAAGLAWQLNYGASDLVLEVIAASTLSADFDHDGDVDENDLATWEGAFGASSAGDTDGDLDSDGADFLTWQREYTGNVNGNLAAALTTVPEPATGIMLLLAMMAVFVRRARLHPQVPVVLILPDLISERA